MQNMTYLEFFPTTSKINVHSYDPEAQTATICAFWNISERMSWYKFKYFQILDKSTQNHLELFSGIQKPAHISKTEVCPYLWSKWASVLAGGMDQISFLAFTW